MDKKIINNLMLQCENEYYYFYYHRGYEVFMEYINHRNTVSLKYLDITEIKLLNYINNINKIDIESYFMCK